MGTPLTLEGWRNRSINVHKMAYIEGYNQRNQSRQVAHLYQQT